jgi:hypothetical protein
MTLQSTWLVKLADVIRYVMLFDRAKDGFTLEMFGSKGKKP